VESKNENNEAMKAGRERIVNHGWTDEHRCGKDIEREGTEETERGKRVNREPHEIGFPSPPRYGCPKQGCSLARNVVANQFPKTEEGLTTDEQMDTDTVNKEPKAGGDRKKWAGKCANPDQGGQKVGKRTGSTHLVRCLTRPGPDNSMQVVDFPHLIDVRLFLEVMKSVFQNQAEHGTGLGNGVEEFWSIGDEGCKKRRTRKRSYRARYVVRNYAGKITHFYAQNRAVITRFCAFLRVRPIF
jgi:hypothetical protein